VVQGTRALPCIQTAHGWEGVEGRGSPPLVVMKRRNVSGIQPANGWSGSQGQERPRAGFRDATSLTHANEVCISAPFGLPALTIDSSTGIRKIELILVFTRYSGVLFLSTPLLTLKCS
jgi:hypothetical protein